MSYEDILAGDSQLRHEFCYTCYTTVGIYDDAADQMATEAEEYADANEVQISEAIVEFSASARPTSRAWCSCSSSS